MRHSHVFLRQGSRRGMLGFLQLKETATTHTLGVLLTKRGHKVLLIDNDPQASLTRACGVTETERRSLADVVGDTDEVKLFGGRG